ncbi:methyltransferase domain-containing protein [Bacillus sp. Bva_UNVM-123]|uniref:class I SAM-dependent methyltransferase n=1 Tax=Bacillus sp. Bva_UNVM-123 TaxID=2829798 RepID=UPI00391F511F
MEKSRSLLFLRKFLLQPKQIGSVWPSSQFLAAKMVQYLHWNNVRSIAELGAGTGAITKAIESCVSESTKVFLYEKDHKMNSMLQAKYPQFICFSDACTLTEDIQQHGVEQLDCVISGLPFFNFPPETREKLITQVVNALKPGGYFIAFQYSLQMKKELAKAFTIEKIGFVPFNTPPAFVYVCRK